MSRSGSHQPVLSQLKPSRTRNCLPNVLQREYSRCQSLGSDDFYVRSFVRCQYERLFQPAQQKDLFGHFGCVNAVEFTASGEHMISGGDDGRVLLWPVAQAIAGQPKPRQMAGQHSSNVFCVGATADGARLYSAGNDCTLLEHDAATGLKLAELPARSQVYELSVEPLTGQTVLLATRSRRLLCHDRRAPRLTELKVGTSMQYFSVQHCPVQSQLVLTSSSGSGVCLYDLRRPDRWLVRYRSGFGFDRANHARFDRQGARILALRPRLPPIVYQLQSDQMQVMCDHPGYYNSTTRKSACFAGPNDEYVVAGSDDFRVYVWTLPAPSSGRRSAPFKVVADDILEGHRSVVNQTRFNYTHSILATSGVEKEIKLWSPMTLDARRFEREWPCAYDPAPSFEEDDHGPPLESASFRAYLLQHGKRWSREEQEMLRPDLEMLNHFHKLVQRDVKDFSGLDDFSDESDDEDEEDGVEVADRQEEASQAFSYLATLIQSVNASCDAYAKVLEKKEDGESNELYRQRCERQQMQLLATLKRLRPMQRELLFLLHRLKMRLDAILKAIQQLPGRADKSEPDDKPLRELRNSPLQQQIAQLHKPLSYLARLSKLWAEMMSDLSSLQHDRRVELPVPKHLHNDPFLMFLQPVGHMVKRLLENGFKSDQPHMYWLSPSLLANVQKAIFLLLEASDSKTTDTMRRLLMTGEDSDSDSDTVYHLESGDSSNLGESDDPSDRSSSLNNEVVELDSDSDSSPDEGS